MTKHRLTNDNDVHFTSHKTQFCLALVLGKEKWHRDGADLQLQGPRSDPELQLLLCFHVGFLFSRPKNIPVGGLPILNCVHLDPGWGSMVA